MGLQLQRAKKRHWLLTVLYRLDKLVPLSNARKLKFYLDLEWIFNRLVMEKSFKHYPPAEHPFRTDSWKFISKYINNESVVLDLGCKYGEFASVIATKAKNVVGIDYDEGAVTVAQKNYQQIANLEFIAAEALEYLNKQEKSFNILILSHILEHLDEPKAFIQKFKGFFKNIYIELPDFDATYHNHYRVKTGTSLVYTDMDHVTEFDRFELQDLIKSCNMEIVEAEYRFGVQKLWCKVQ